MSAVDKSRLDVPVLNASKAPETEFYVMECTLTTEREERVGDVTTTKRSEFSGYLSKEVLGTALGIMREVIA